KGKHFSVRAIVSTLAGEGVDSLIFFPIAFAGMMPVHELIRMMLTQMILKTLYEIIILPVTIRVVKYVKQFEGIDTYDNHISYNIFKIDDF
ncbi:MAG: VUT family protein, partial [Phocaeicola sp.]|nr:VUT family protein [Phocaeicola sp.]